ncbi:hypothetical protein D6D13_06477 [Aureobasidium pullulans]|uniref:Thiolase-like protein n=1 Tax=Aureobasidium pullulans TaxID=5580 RepID=A0A4S9CHG2_AURPU|nr:hypothetical protein D6D13_06477 [Aureobasidium pullulans]
MRKTTSANEMTSTPRLWITGMGSQYPAHLLTPDDFDAFAARFYDVKNLGIRRLLKINRTTGIKTRSSVSTYDAGFADDAAPPSIADMDALFRSVGVDMTVKACCKAIEDWGGVPSDITHTVAVTCTNQGNAGYDFLVNEKLGLSHSVDRTLLHGVGCAGGLAIMRTAAQLAHGATGRGRPARILCFACELSTPNVRYELDAAANCVDLSQLCIAGVLFSDAAAAFVLCNDLGMQEGVKPVFELLEWDNALIPETLNDLTFHAEPTGYRMMLSRDVPRHTVAAVCPVFESLLQSINSLRPCDKLNVKNFDWALHPGGQLIIEKVKQALHLSDDQLRATYDTYRTRGNSSSPSVLIVMDKLRSEKSGNDFVVATAFGPGLAVEMSIFRRCYENDDATAQERR